MIVEDAGTVGRHKRPSRTPTHHFTLQPYPCSPRQESPTRWPHLNHLIPSYQRFVPRAIGTTLQPSAQRLRCCAATLLQLCHQPVPFQASIHPCFVDPRRLAHVSAQSIRPLYAAVFDTALPIMRRACCMAFLLSDAHCHLDVGG